MPALAAIGAVVGAVGTGLSYVSQMSAANTAQTFSNLNAQAGVQAAQQQSAIASLQANLQEQQATTAKQAAFQNAESMRQQADQDAKIGQENIRRGRDDFMRQLAQANAQAGGSGATVATGSPLDYLLNAADTEKQREAGENYQINAGRVAGYRAAAGEELGGRVQGMDASLYQIQSLAAIDAGRTGVAQAKLQGFAGAAQAQGMRNSALGGLFSGIGQNLNSWKKRY